MDNLHMPMRLHVKIRHRRELVPALIEVLGEYEVVVIFDKTPTRHYPGKAAVFDDGEIAVGGVWIR